MQYIATTGWEDGTADLTKRLINELATGKKVLWLLSGGSNITSSVLIMEKVTAELSKNLTVGLIDERYGPVGGDTSNWQQLLNSGFKPKKATVMTVLTEGLNLQQTADSYDTKLREARDHADITIVQLGVGADGHISGILPGSIAATEAHHWVVGYDSTPYLRVTSTPVAFNHIDVAYAFAFGEGKRLAVRQLSESEVSIPIQPAQLLKTLPEAYLYSDQIGEQV